MDNIRLIQALSDAFGPSGFEDDVTHIVVNELDSLHPQADHMRNVIVDAKGNGPKVMLDAHEDEVGLIVHAIKPNGTLRILALGGISPSSLQANTFYVKSDTGKLIKGIVASVPPHFQNKQVSSIPTFADLLLDIGTTSYQETIDLGIHIGSPACPAVRCEYDQERDLFLGKAFDCRIGVAAEIEVLKRLSTIASKTHVFGSFSSQEEVGERGVFVNGQKIQPDVMICFEGCPADDTFSEEYMIQAAIGKGPMLRHADNSMITNWHFQKLALDIARKHNIPVQESVRVGGGTNAAIVNKFFAVPSIVIGIPVRYIHSSHCFVKKCDYDNAIALCLMILESLDADTIKTL